MPRRLSSLEAVAGASIGRQTAGSSCARGGPWLVYGVESAHTERSCAGRGVEPRCPLITLIGKRETPIWQW